MNENTQEAIVVRESQAVAKPLTVNEIVAQVRLIQEVMEKVMRENEHFGKIPGCGDKPTLLKAGAEKLGMTFRLAASFDVEVIDLPNNHREYRVKCTLTNMGNGGFVGQGVGCCSTMEAKYRYRTGPRTSTGRPVPKEYWDLRASEPAKAQAMLGGKGYSTMKDDNGMWVICEQGEKVEHDNPADYLNTVLKMAKKRAHVDAILTATAASDIFTQDIDDLADNDAAPVKNTTTKTTPQQNTTKQPRKKTDPHPEETKARLEDESNPELMPRKGSDQVADESQAEPGQTEDLAEGQFSVQGQIAFVTQKSGKKKDGTPYTRYGCKVRIGEEEIWYNSFDSTLGKLAEKLKGKNVTIVYEEEEYNGDTIKNLVGIRL